MRAVVFTPYSIFVCSQESMPSEWFRDFLLPSFLNNLKRVEIDGIVYIIETNCESDAVHKIVINLYEAFAVLSDDQLSPTAFDRIAKVARKIYTKTVSIPESWKPHYEREIWSIYASSRGKGQGSRLHFDTRPNSSEDLFVFARTDEVLGFNKIPRSYSVYTSAVEKFADAILTETCSYTIGDSLAGIVLTEKLHHAFTKGASLAGC